MSGEPEQQSRAVWRNPAWIGALATLITAVVGLLGLFIVRGGGSSGTPATGPTTVASSTPPRGNNVAAEINSDEVPLTVNVATETSAVGDSWTFPPGSARPDEFTGTTGDELKSWLGVHGRIGREQTLKLSIRGKAAEPVVIRGLRATVLEAAQPDAASSLVWSYGCGEIPVRSADINLEDPALKFKWSDENGALAQAPTLRVDTTDIEVIEVVASVRKRDVSWRLIVEYEFGGQSGELQVDDNGQPFRVTSAAPDTNAYRAQRAVDDFKIVREPRSDGSLGGYC